MKISAKKYKQIIVEEIKRQLLLEVSLEKAKESFFSKKFVKLFTRELEYESLPRENVITIIDKMFMKYILASIPEDITDNQKGLTLLWILKVLKRIPDYVSIIMNKGRIPISNLSSLFEMFFHYQQFMEQKDLNKVINFSDLQTIVNNARPQIEEYQSKKRYLDAEEGTEVLRDDENWFIAVIHNRGAACELGKETDWCTAAPGLNFFEDYYKPDDPLFYFFDKSNGEKYQFHFGSEQFKDKNDQPVNKDVYKLLENELFYNTQAYKKYEIIKEKIADKRFLCVSRLFLRSIKVKVENACNMFDSHYRTIIEIKNEMQKHDGKNLETLEQIYLSQKESYDIYRERICLLKNIINDFPHVSNYKNTFLERFTHSSRNYHGQTVYFQKSLSDYEKVLLEEYKDAEMFLNRFESEIENDDISKTKEILQEIKEMLDIEIECH